MIYIQNTDFLLTKKEAAEWCRDHVVVSKKDLERIKRLAKRAGFYDRLKALDIQVCPLGDEL